MGLRDILDAATRECAPDDLACVFERDWANEVLADRNHEIVALVLDMGEFIQKVTREWNYYVGGNEWPDALLARLDQIGKEQT